MPKKIKLNIKETEQELKKMIRNCRSERIRARLKTLLLIKTKQIHYKSDLADKVRYHRKTVEGWLADYATNGIPKLLLIESGGNGKKKINEQTHIALEQKLKNPSNGISSYVELLQWVNQYHQTDITYDGLRKYCRRNFGSKLKVGRKSHVKKDSKAKALFLNATR